MIQKRIDLSDRGAFYGIDQKEYIIFRNKHFRSDEKDDNSFMSSLKEKDSKLNIEILERFDDEDEYAIVMLNGFEVNIILTIDDEEQDLLFVPPSNIIATLRK